MVDDRAMERNAAATLAQGPADRMLECVEIRIETPTVKTFVLRDLDATGSLLFVSGQSMMLTLNIDGEQLQRTFSIASSPLGTGMIELTIKAPDSGRATRWLHDVLRPGMTLGARYPLGQFGLEFDMESLKPLALVSAGSGASPLMSMLRTLAVRCPNADVAWFHAARGMEDILFARELTTLQTRMPNLKVSVALSAPAPGWFGLRGRVSRRIISAVTPDFNLREVYCCGPASFMEEVRRIHAADGARHAGFHIEHFAPVDPFPPEAPHASDALDNRVTHHVKLGGKSFQVHANETILMAASRQNVVIPCGCASGICGTCKLRRLSGVIEMRHQGGLSDEEEARGYVLACSSRALSDVTLEF
jgi:ferredoxin-NADP reductase